MAEGSQALMTLTGQQLNWLLDGYDITVMKAIKLDIMSLFFKEKPALLIEIKYNIGMILKNFPALEHDDSLAFLSPELIADLLEKAQRVDEG